MSLQVSTGPGSLIALGLSISDVATLFSLSKQYGNWLSTASGDKDLLELLDQDEMDVLRRGGLIDTARFNKRWGSELVIFANGQSQTFRGEKAEKALEPLGQLSATLVCIVAALDAFCSTDLVKSVIRSTLLEVLAPAEYGEDIVTSQYTQRINSWRSSATVRGMSAEARRIRKDLIHREAVFPGLMPPGDLPHMVSFLVWLLTDKSDSHTTQSSDVAGVAWCLSRIGIEVLGVCGPNMLPSEAPIQLQYNPDAAWVMSQQPMRRPLDVYLSRQACTTVSLGSPNESLTKFPIDQMTANRCRSAWDKGQRAAASIACRPWAPQIPWRSMVEGRDIEYIFYDVRDGAYGRVGTEIYNLVSLLGFAVNTETCDALAQVLEPEAPDVLGRLERIVDRFVDYSIEDPELEVHIINAYTVLQAFFMGYYYGIFLPLVDTSMLGLPVVEGGWGFRSNKFFYKMASIYGNKSYPRLSNGRCIPREAVIDILSALLLGNYQEISADNKKPVYSRNAWCIGVVNKRALLTYGVLRPCVTSRDVGRFMLVDADVSSIPVGSDGLIRPGVSESLKLDCLTLSSRHLSPLQQSDMFGPDSKLQEDVTFHMEPDWDGDSTTMLLCVRYKGRRVQTINPATADLNFLRSLVRPATDGGEEIPDSVLREKLWTVTDFFAKSPPAREHGRDCPELFMALSELPRFRYFVTEAYSSIAHVSILLDSLDTTRQKVLALEGVVDERCHVILDCRGCKDEHESDEWYSEETERELRHLKVDTHFMHLGRGAPSRKGRGR
ncbi:hypothetical protein F53441_3284 [Fusarium austroafricanum]|uniref:Uncharacterized protein n=1 Tax=Fusarium austroafricanum TaxID=2364996 RepID=A0A8H4KRA5_9HYPO|nr:hypothetical protein F53441_3284 [Fusarium austroafricanum]